MQNYYSRTQEILAEMIKESASWYQLVDDLRKMPKLLVRVNRDGSIDASLNIFHYLDNHLERTDESVRLERALYGFASKKGRELSWPKCIEEFYEKKLVKSGWKHELGENTYNRNSMLSGGMQYEIYMDKYHDQFAIIQLHGEGDIRVGYTIPRVFKVKNNDWEYLASDDTLLYGKCECTETTSDDGGYTWMNMFPTNWKVKEIDEKYEYYCEKCGKQVEWWN